MCQIVLSDENIRRCLFCKNCLIQGRNEDCYKNYVFQNGLNTTNNIFNISKLYFLKN